MRRAKHLIVTADDFGLSEDVNEAVFQAFGQGVLTSASLMISGGASESAVAFARANPGLAVGLHLVLTKGKATLPPEMVPDLVDTYGRFLQDPVRCGFRYFFRRSLRAQIEREMRAQIERFLETDLPLFHLDGHLHLHVHPTIFDLLLTLAEEYGIKAIRIPLEEPWSTLRLDQRRLGYKLSHALIFTLLTWRSRARLREQGLLYADRVYGLLQDGDVNEQYLSALIPRLKPGITEVYLHPRRGACRELLALTSRQVKALIDVHRIFLTSYKALVESLN